MADEKMPSTPESEALSLSLRQLWHSDAVNILESLDAGNSLVTVGGPGGSGKSQMLRPELVYISRAKGFQTLDFDCQLASGSLTSALNYQIDKQLENKKANKGLIILDDPRESMVEADIKECLSNLRDKGYKHVIVLMNTGRQEKREGLERWETIERENGGSVVSFAIAPKRLDTDLAVRFLKQYQSLNPLLIEYIVTHYPTYPRTLEAFYNCQTETEVRHKWIDLHPSNNGGNCYYGFSLEEADEVNRKLGVEVF